MDKRQVIAKAKRMGADRLGVSYLKQYTCLGQWEKEPFMYHFFKNGLEIGNYAVCLEPNVKIQKMKPPREWHSSFLKDLKFFDIDLF